MNNFIWNLLKGAVEQIVQNAKPSQASQRSLPEENLNTRTPLRIDLSDVTDGDLSVAAILEALNLKE